MNTTNNSRHEFRFVSEDGLQIACTDGKAVDLGVIQIAHGLGEHIGLYSDLIAVL